MTLLGCVASVFILIAPAASASTLNTLTAPYVGYNESLDTTATLFCSGVAKVLKFPDFNLTTGHAVAGANATDQSCPGPTYVLSRSQVIVQAGFTANLSAGIHGAAHFVAHWVLSYKGGLHVHAGAAHQFAAAAVIVQVSGTLYNGSGSIASFTQFQRVYSLNTTTGTNLAISATSLVAPVYLNTTLFTTGHYSFYTWVVADALVEVEMGGSSSADSQFSMFGAAGHSSLTSFKF